MGRAMNILWIVVGLILVVWGLTTDTTWLKWLLIVAGVLSIALQIATIIRRSGSG